MSTTFCLYDENVSTEISEANRALHVAINRLYDSVAHATHVFMCKRSIAIKMTNNITNPEKMFRLAMGIKLPLVASDDKFTYFHSTVEHKLYTIDSIKESLRMIEKAIIVWDNIAYQEEIGFRSPILVDSNGILTTTDSISFKQAVSIVRQARDAKRVFLNL